MNNYLFASVENMWLLAGWTMIHFLWLGTLVAMAALACRWSLGRASANVRYAVALSCLVLLVALPVGIATWLPQSPSPKQQERGAGPAAPTEDLPIDNAPNSAPINLAAQGPPQTTAEPALVELHQPNAPTVAATNPAP